jgi:undecaprenyl-diphosphatase
VDWDRALFFEINGWAKQSEVLDWFMLECSNAGNFVVLALVYLGYRVWLNWRRGLLAASVLGVAIGLSDFLGMQLKLFFARPRPCQAFLHMQELVGCGKAFSMPSNHAMNSATAAAFLWVIFPSTRWVVGAMMMLVGLSRIYLGAHYPTDVLAGWGVGSMVGMTLGYAVIRSKWFQQEGPSEQKLGG